MAFVMRRDQTALCSCFGNPSVRVFLPSILFYQPVNPVQFLKLLPCMNPHALCDPWQPCWMVPHFTFSERKNKRKLLLLDSKMLPVITMCASVPVDTVLPCCSNKLMKGNRTESRWAERMQTFLRLACHSSSPSHVVYGPSSWKGWGGAQKRLLLRLKAISLGAGCTDAVHFFKY